MYTPRLPLIVGHLLSVMFLMTTELSADQKSTETKVEPGFVAIFNEKDLSGWEGDKKLWKVRDGMIVGDSAGIPKNQFLATKKQYENFELRLEFRLHGGKGNSGIQFRSKRVPESHEVEGYQADIGENYWGCLYDEHRRRKVLVQAPPKLGKVLNKEGWNRYMIRAQGNHIVMKINGITTVDYTEQQADIPRRGIIAVQVHSGPPLRIDFRKLRIRELKGDK